MIKVGFIGNFQKDSVNGVANAVNTLAEGLIARGVKVFFYGIANKAFSFSEEGFVYRKFKKGLHPFSISPEFYQFLKENPDEISVFHFHSVFIPFFVPVQKILVANNYPYVITPHGGYDNAVLNKNKLVKKLYFHFFEKKILRKAACLICVHEEEVRNLIKIAKTSKTEVIFNAIKKPGKNVATNEGRGIIELVYLGRYDISHKGLDKLFYIFKKIEEENSSVYLSLFGQGRDKQKLEKLKQSLGLRNVKIYEPVYGADKEGVLLRATAYVQLSNWEVFGISIAEAMLKGKPVILSTNCAMAGYIAELGVGLVVDTNDFEKAAREVLTYLQNSSLMASDGEVLRQLAEKEFSMESVAEKTHHLYLKAVNNPQNGLPEAFIS